jgi:hypothetical protein
MQMIVHVTTQAGLKYRPRAKLMWPAGTFELRVVDNPGKPNRNEAGELMSPVEITAEQLEQLRADRPWFVVEEPGAESTVAELKAEIARLNAEVVSLTSHLESLTKPAAPKR